MDHSTGTKGSVLPTMNMYTNRPVSVPFRASKREEAERLNKQWPGDMLPLGPLGLLQYSPRTIKQAVGDKRAAPFIDFRTRLQALLKKRARKVPANELRAVVMKAARRGRTAVARVVAGDAMTINDRRVVFGCALALLEANGIGVQEFAQRLAKQPIDLDDDAATAGQGADSDDENTLVISSTQ